MTTKIAVSLPDDQVATARQAVRDGRAASVSAYVSEALAQRVEDDSLAALLADLDREHGPVSEDVRAWARGVGAGLESGEPSGARPAYRRTRG